jgi:hypothetical protein
MQKGRCVHDERLGSTLNGKAFKDEADGLEYLFYLFLFLFFGVAKIIGH